MNLLPLICLLPCLVLVQSQRRVGRLTEVYAWKQLTYNIDGELLTVDRRNAPTGSGSGNSFNSGLGGGNSNPNWNGAGNSNPNWNGGGNTFQTYPGSGGGNSFNTGNGGGNRYPNGGGVTGGNGNTYTDNTKDMDDAFQPIYFNNDEDEKNNIQHSHSNYGGGHSGGSGSGYGNSGGGGHHSPGNHGNGGYRHTRDTSGKGLPNVSPLFDSSSFLRSSIPRPNVSEAEMFYIKYNNVPMGAERVGDRLFVTVPRRRYGIPATLNYIDLSSTRERSPTLRPYPNIRESRSLVNVYRTRADNCGRLWMVDTGLLEVPVEPRQLQQPSIVIYDLATDRQILKYELKDSDVPTNTTPTGLASITVDTSSGCDSAFAYIPDLTTYGIVVFSLRDRDSWRVTHNYLYFNPAAATLNSAGQRFQWNDGIFSLTLGPAQGRGGCRTAYFHPMISFQEFSVSTCILNNRTAVNDSTLWEQFQIVGERGPNSQSTMNDVHYPTGVMFFAEVGRDAVSCWNMDRVLTPDNVDVLARDTTRLSYPADLHVTGNEIWVTSNTLPRFGYARLDPNEYNFYIYKANIPSAIEGTRCAPQQYGNIYQRPDQESYENY